MGATATAKNGHHANGTATNGEEKKEVVYPYKGTRARVDDSPNFFVRTWRNMDWCLKAVFGAGLLLGLVKLGENYNYFNENNWPLLHTLRKTAYLKVVFDERDEEFMHTPWEAYWLFLLPMGPIIFSGWATILSLVSGEWKLGRAMQREALATVRGITVSSPLIALLQKGVFEQRIGKLYWDMEEYGWPYFFLSIPLYMLFADAVFYWSHRLLHMSFLYQYHHLHHSFRPPTSYAGAAADCIEVIFNGYTTTFVPIFFMPLHGRFFLLMSFINMAWAAFLHNYYEWSVPGGIVYSCADHNVHHSFGQKNYNYALYTLLWDKLLGTYRKEKPASLKKVKGF